MGDSGFNLQDYVDFFSLDGLSDEDAAAIFAALCEDAETSNTQSDSSPSLSQEHNSIAQPPESVTGAPEPPPVPEGACCGICMESKAHNEFFNTNFCTHLYCNECVGSYVTDKVEDGMGWINCPEPGCESGFLDPEACRPVLPQGVIDRWGYLICEAMIKVKFYCPYKNCSALLMDDQERGADEEEDIITRCECPHCYRLFCAQCRSPWHKGLKCEEVQELGEGDREEEDLMLKQVAGNSKWQRCPECKFFVERNEGCNHITCRCKYEFCYSCGAKWKSSHYSCGAK